MFPQNKWHRSQKNKYIAGVAEVYETSANTVRIIYVIAALCGVPMVAVYLLQWLIYPKR
ncbi:PspC domain-containing protein [Corynebacterium diphtheriae]